jgi:HSP20 family protein
MTTAVAKREPRAFRAWEPFQQVRDEVETLWNQLTGERTGGWLAQLNVPPLDLSETPTSVEVRFDLPGFKADEINVQLSNNVLTVSGERQEERKEQSETFHRIERRTGSFSRSVALPARVAEEKVDAQYRDGVLTISMAKTEEAKGRKIKVKA